MTVIVLDGELKSALCAVRSLGRAGISVYVGSSRPFAMAGYSKYAKGRFVYSNPKKQKTAFVDSLKSEAKNIHERTGVLPLIFCFSDATTNALFDEYDSLSSFIQMVLPSRESYIIARNKRKTYESAEKLSVPTIKTYKPESFGELTFPVVVKYAESVLWREGACVGGSAEFVFSQDELKKKVAEITKKTGEAPLVQQFVKGEEYGVEMVCDKGEALATFVHKRIRSLSPRGGAAVVKETAQDTEEVKLMKQYAQVLVKELSWHGPVMVEFKIDDRAGHVLLMEINGRFWGSLPLAVRAGVDFPLLAYKLGVGKGVTTTPAFATPYVRTRHFLGDVLWFWRVLFARDPMRPHLYPSRLRAWWNFEKEICISHSDTFSWSDPLPGFMEYVSIMKR